MHRENHSGAPAKSNVTPHASIVDLDSKAGSRTSIRYGASRMLVAAVAEIAAGSRSRSRLRLGSGFHSTSYLSGNPIEKIHVDTLTHFSLRVLAPYPKIR